MPERAEQVRVILTKRAEDAKLLNITMKYIKLKLFIKYIEFCNPNLKFILFFAPSAPLRPLRPLR